MRNIIIGKPNKRSQKAQSLVKILYLFSNNCKIKDWLIIGEEFTVSIENQASSGRDILRMKPIAVRTSREVLKLGNL